MHCPAALSEPCSWYCQVATSGGCQHEPAVVLQGTGAGSAAAAGLAWRVAGVPAQPGAAGKSARMIMAPASDPSVRAPRIGTLPASARRPDQIITSVRERD